MRLSHAEETSTASTRSIRPGRRLLRACLHGTLVPPKAATPLASSGHARGTGPPPTESQLHGRESWEHWPQPPTVDRATTSVRLAMTRNHPWGATRVTRDGRMVDAGRRFGGDPVAGTRDAGPAPARSHPVDHIVGRGAATPRSHTVWTSRRPRRTRRARRSSKSARAPSDRSHPWSSHVVPLTTLYRGAAAAGGGSAAVLLINAAKRATVIPTTALNEAVTTRVQARRPNLPTAAP